MARARRSSRRAASSPSSPRGPPKGCSGWTSIGGSTMAIESINPATGERLQTHEEMPHAAVEAIIGKTHAAFVGWRRTSFDERARPMRAAAQVLRAKAEVFARLMAQEIGKPVR